MAAKYAIQQFWISNSIWTPIVCPIIWIPASANVTIFPGAYGLMNFATGIGFAVTTTENGSTTAAVTGMLFYE